VETQLISISSVSTHLYIKYHTSDLQINANLKVSSNEESRSLCTDTRSTRLLLSDEYSSAVSLQWHTK